MVIFYKVKPTVNVRQNPYQRPSWPFPVTQATSSNGIYTQTPTMHCYRRPTPVAPAVPANAPLLLQHPPVLTNHQAQFARYAAPVTIPGYATTSRPAVPLVQLRSQQPIITTNPGIQHRAAYNIAQHHIVHNRTSGVGTIPVNNPYNSIPIYQNRPIVAQQPTINVVPSNQQFNLAQQIINQNRQAVFAAHPIINRYQGTPVYIQNHQTTIPAPMRQINIPTMIVSRPSAIPNPQAYITATRYPQYTGQYQTFTQPRVAVHASMSQPPVVKHDAATKQQPTVTIPQPETTESTSNPESTIPEYEEVHTEEHSEEHSFNADSSVPPTAGASGSNGNPRMMVQKLSIRIEVASMQV